MQPRKSRISRRGKWKSLFLKKLVALASSTTVILHLSYLMNVIRPSGPGQSGIVPHWHSAWHGGSGYSKHLWNDRAENHYPTVIFKFLGIRTTRWPIKMQIPRPQRQFQGECALLQAFLMMLMPTSLRTSQGNLKWTESPDSRLTDSVLGKARVYRLTIPSLSPPHC